MLLPSQKIKRTDQEQLAMLDKNIKKLYKQAKSRQRTRSTVIEDEVSKQNRRQQRRLSEKREIAQELDFEQSLIEESLCEGGKYTEYCNEYCGCFDDVYLT